MYILFDYVSDQIPSLETISEKEVFAIANMTDLGFTSGRWVILGNIEVKIENVILPHYIGIDNSISDLPSIKSYYSDFIRFATEDEFQSSIKRLIDKDKEGYDYWTTTCDSCFEELARIHFLGQEPSPMSQCHEIIFKGSRWDSSVNTEGTTLQEYLKNLE